MTFEQIWNNKELSIKEKTELTHKRIEEIREIIKKRREELDK